MSQEHIERFLGKLLTDEDFFEEIRLLGVKAALKYGLYFTSAELKSIEAMDLNKFAVNYKNLNDRLTRSGPSITLVREKDVATEDRRQ